MLLGYARVSKGDEQTNALQVRALRAAGCRRMFEEAACGGRRDRPELHRLLEMARLFGISEPTVSRIVAEHRTASPAARSAAARRSGGADDAGLEEAASEEDREDPAALR